MQNMADKLLEEINKKQNPSVVGLDPRINQIPEFITKRNLEAYGNSFKAAANAIIEFNKLIINAISETLPAVKPQIAFYEQYGPEGVRAFKETVDYAKEKGLIVIGDAKRNDIGSTAEAYADGHLGEVKMIEGSMPSLNADLITVNGYLGSDGLMPFIEACKKHGKGIFILNKTSNPSSGELQDKKTEEGKTVYEIMAELIDKLGKDLTGQKGYSPIGAVVGATYPEQAKILRNLMPKTIFLVPGYGAQGGGAEDVVPCFNEDGYGAIVNSSRGIIFAYEKEPYKDKFKPEEFHLASRQAAIDMKKDILDALQKNGKLPEGWNA